MPAERKRKKIEKQSVAKESRRAVQCSRQKTNGKRKRLKSNRKTRCMSVSEREGATCLKVAGGMRESEREHATYTQVARNKNKKDKEGQTCTKNAQSMKEKHTKIGNKAKEHWQPLGSRKQLF